MKGSELILKMLEQKGIDRVFGYPGGAIMPLYDALYDSSVEHHLFRHEQGAGFAAIGYARATGKVGVCFATSGPGATNLITSLADAMLDSVPVVAITGQVATNVQGTDAFQEADVLGLSLAVTKHSYLVKDVNELQAVLHDAFEVAMDGRPGPVLVDVSKDVQLADVEMQPMLSVAQPEVTAEVDEGAIAQACELLAQAKQPVLYVGGGVGMADAVAELRELQNTTNIPGVCTLKGIGALDRDNPHFLGMLGMHGNQSANLAVHDCDLLVAIGARFDDRVTGKLDTFAPNAKVIHLDADRAEANKLRRPDVAIHDDLKQVLPRLAKAAVSEELLQPWQQQCHALQQAYGWRYDFEKEGIYAPLVLKQLSEKMPENAVVCCDVGQHQMWVAQHMSFSEPKNHLTSGGLGTMGFGLPAAIGAKFSRPDDFVVAVSGDGSFMMNVQELQTIKRYQLPVKILLIDNERLGMVRQWQQLFFDSRYSETNLSDNPDFVKLADVFGIPGRTITKGSEVEHALDEFVSADGPRMLHVRIDADDNVWPLVPPGKSNKEMLEEV